MEKITTLVIVHDQEKVLLGMKKRGFGEGLWNGFGGKIDNGETIIEAAKRELQEESGIIATEILEKGELNFTFEKDPLQIKVHLFVVNNFSGDPIETEEMKPQWFLHHEVPYHQMWVDDVEWMPKVLAGQAVNANFHIESMDNQIILRQNLTTF